MFFEKAGQKFMKGVKTSLAPESIDWDKVLKIGTALLKIGVFAALALKEEKCKENNGQTIIINNYICGGKENEK